MYFWIKYFITLEEDFYKIAAFILIAIFICACNAVKKSSWWKQPHKNQITVNGKATKAENVFNQLYQNQIALYY
jgi:hypothetical protein